MEVIEEPDLTGPILIAVILGILLLLAGKSHFGDIYVMFIVGNILSYLIFNFMSQVRFFTISGRCDSSLQHHEHTRLWAIADVGFRLVWDCVFVEEYIGNFVKFGNFSMVIGKCIKIHGVPDENQHRIEQKAINHVPTVSVLR